MTCPCCQATLTEAQVKSIWASYCASRVTPEARKRAGAKPWANHSEKAGRRCRCVDCIKLRELEVEKAEREHPTRRKPISPEDLTWDAILSADPGQGYEALIRRETSLLVAAERHKTKRKLAASRYDKKIRGLKARAKKDGTYTLILAEAKRRAEERLKEEN